MSAERHRLVDRGGTVSVLREGLTSQELADLEAVIDSAEELLGPGSLPALDEIHDFDLAGKALNTGWSRIRTALREGGRAAQPVHDASSLDDLLTRLKGAEETMHAAQVRTRDRAVRIASETLAGLQDMTSVAQLVDAGAEALCRLGFDRAIVSSVRESVWLTEAVHVDGDPEWAGAILEAGRSTPVPIHAGLPEQEMVRRRKPIVVTKVQQNRARLHQAVADASLSRSYVAAPIMPRSRVIGFLHGDRFFHRGDVSQFDSDLVGLFAQGYGFALERALLLQELETLRGQVRGFSSSLNRLADPGGAGQGADAGWPLAVPATGLDRAQDVVVLPVHHDDADSRLTRRELEVLRLMAAGDTNLRIAHKLIISQGTVKSHVKHILRKLGAANRAEAVARWHSGSYAS